MKKYFFLNFVLVSLLANFLFIFNIYFPIWVSVLIMMIVSFFLINRFINKKSGILILIIWVVYALPFIHLPSYIWFNFNDDYPEFSFLWGLQINPYMIDERVIKLTAMILSVGALGIATGVSIGHKKLKKDTGLDQNNKIKFFKTLNLSIWFIWVAIGVALTALSAPKNSIFVSIYTDSQSSLDGLNFSSAWMMSYVILTFAFCDTILENSVVLKKIKMKIIILAFFIVVFYFQLLRGDRECLPWVFGIIIIYYYWAGNYTKRNNLKLPYKKITIGTIAIFFVSLIVGYTRTSLNGASLSDFATLIYDLFQSDVDVSNYLSGTWSAVLLTPLSVAGDHVYGLLPLKLGKDYINLFLSTPPGFLTDAIGYIRPIDAMSGPAWEMRYGMGGTHASVLPFMNFRMVGIFVIPLIWSYIIVKFESFAISKVNVSSLSLLTVLVMASPHWLWYGEKNLINAIMMWAAFTFTYKISIGISNHSNKLYYI